MARMNIKECIASFAENTTFHGYRNIFVGNIFRRFLWIAIVLGFTGFMVNQLYRRIEFYRQWPTTVDFRIYSTNKMTFPAVTFCNLNTFKLTVAEEKRFMEAIDLLTGGTLKLSRRSVHYIPQRDSATVNVEELITETAHDRKDLIVKCRWLNQPCSHLDFVPILTRSGLCYVFNGNVTSEQRVTRSPGTGLELVLNSETYEYMVGDNAGAGIRLLVHDKNVYPSVYELGHEIATDTDTRMDIKFTDVRNMETPYGDCEHVGLRYLNNTYTVAACEMECMSDFVFSHCGCKDAFMAGPHPICNVSDMICIKDTMNVMTDEVVQCDCPPPCAEYRYETMFSYASLSDFAVQRMQASLDDTDIQKAVLRSMLVYRQSVKRSEDLFSVDLKTLEQTKGIFSDIVLTLLNMTTERSFSDMMYFKQICADETNGERIRAAEIFWREYVVSPFVFYFSNLASVFTIYHNIEHTIQQMPNADKSSVEGSPLIKLCDRLMYQIQQISSNYSMFAKEQHVNAFLPGHVVSNTTGKFRNLYSKLVSVKHALMNDTQVDFMDGVDRVSLDILSQLSKSEHILWSRILYTKTSPLSNKCFRISGDEEKVLQLILHCKDDLATQLFNAHDKLTKLHSMHMTTNTTLDDFRLIDAFLKKVKDDAVFYSLFSSIDSWMNKLNISLLHFYHVGEEITLLAGEETSMIDRGTHLTQTHLNKIKRQLYIIAQSLDEVYYKWVTQLQTERDRTRIDATFYRKNFIHLRLAYHELSYRKIVQSDSYGLFALLSDIGGSMGLFIGGSMISVIELVEFFFVSIIFVNAKFQDTTNIPTDVNGKLAEEQDREMDSF